MTKDGTNFSMIFYPLLITALFLNNAVLAHNHTDVNDICRNKYDKATCHSKYKHLPNLKSLPRLPMNRPIKIKVIPYQSKS